MVDCADLGNCSIPTWLQYAILLFVVVLFLVKAFSRNDPYDRM